MPPIRTAFARVNDAVDAVASATRAGTSFVFGYLGGGPLPFELKTPGSEFILAFQAPPIALVMSVLTTLLFYWGILPPIIRGFSRVLERTLGVGGAVGLSTAANVFVGMVEAPLFIRPYLDRLSRSELFVVMTGGMAGIAGTVFVVYATLLRPIIPNSEALTTSRGWVLIILGNLLGFVFAVVVLAISVISFPLLLDRDVGAAIAVQRATAAVLNAIYEEDFLAKLFRRVFLEKLVAAHEDGRLTFFGDHSALSAADAFAAYLAPLRRTKWFVYAKRPFAGPAAVLAYLSRYTHRVALSNRRLIAADSHGVTFTYKDYRREGRDRYRTMTLSPHEFIRRFLIHVLPKGFHRIRHYGLFASAERRHNIAQLRQWLAVPAPKPEVDDVEDKAAASKPLAPACPCCGGRMVIIETFERGATPRHRPTTPIRRLRIDTS